MFTITLPFNTITQNFFHSRFSLFLHSLQNQVQVVKTQFTVLNNFPYHFSNFRFTNFIKSSQYITISHFFFRKIRRINILVPNFPLFQNILFQQPIQQRLYCSLFPVHFLTKHLCHKLARNFAICPHNSHYFPFCIGYMLFFIDSAIFFHILTSFNVYVCNLFYII